jgi:hypothetical protein
MPNPENIEPHKFKEGESGNPNGRPKGSRNLSTILKEMLEEEVEVNIDGKKERRQFKDVIIRKLIKKANDGDLRAIQEVFDRTEGKSKQEIRHDILTPPPKFVIHKSDTSIPEDEK